MRFLDYNWSARGEFPGFGTRPGGVPLGKDTLPALTVVEETVADALVLHAQGRLTIEDVRGLKRSLEVDLCDWRARRRCVGRSCLPE